MKRRRFLVGAGSLAAGSAATLGTGAFSSGSIERGMKAHVANDTNAYVQLTRCGGAKHITYRNGRLVLDFTNATPPSNNKDYSTSATGLNDEAVSCFNRVFVARIKDPDPQTLPPSPTYKYRGWISTDVPYAVSFYQGQHPSRSVTGRTHTRDFKLPGPGGGGGCDCSGEEGADDEGQGDEDHGNQYIRFPVGVCIDLRRTPSVNPGDNILAGKHFTLHVEKVHV